MLYNKIQPELWELEQYAPLIDRILKKGEKRKTRNADTYSLFGESLTIDVSREFPLLRGRKMFYNGVLGELAAFFRGPKNVEDFQKFGCNYWNAWGNNTEVLDALGDPEKGKRIGDINVDYGNAWLDFNGVNQLEELVQRIKSNPTDRRLIVSGWRPDRLHELSLPCCHMLYQWYVREGKYLDMVWYQRSVDTMVGLPSDIVLCAAWNIILAQQCGLNPGVIKLFLGDTHIYANHLEPTLDYLKQLQKADFSHPIAYTIKMDVEYSTFVPEQLEIYNYNPSPAVKFELNV